MNGRILYDEASGKILSGTTMAAPNPPEPELGYKYLEEYADPMTMWIKDGVPTAKVELPCAISNETPAVDETVTFTDLPDCTILFQNNYMELPVTDGTFLFTPRAKGVYEFVIEEPAYLTKRITIYAD